MSLRIGCCITPHGFGHAARTAAILEALGRRRPVHGVVVTLVPRWFFADSLSMPFSYHQLTTDIGLVQKNSLEEDLPATLQALNGYYPLAEELVDRAVRLFTDCDCILCDISPLGIVAADRLGVPSILVENFTWDWIYRGYIDREPAFVPYIDYLQSLYGKADYRLQTAPVCRPVATAFATGPVSRQGRKDRQWIRRFLDIDEHALVVLITMGGVSGDEYDMEPLRRADGYVFLVAGRGESLVRSGNLRLLPRQCGLYHPDLTGAADLVVGKVGYSTLAEVYAAGVPYGYIARKEFRESGVLVDFIHRNRLGLEIRANELYSGDWLRQIPAIMALRCNKAGRENGADAAADFILNTVMSSVMKK